MREVICVQFPGLSGPVLSHLSRSTGRRGRGGALSGYCYVLAPSVGFVTSWGNGSVPGLSGWWRVDDEHATVREVLCRAARAKLVEAAACLLRRLAGIDQLSEVSDDSELAVRVDKRHAQLSKRSRPVKTIRKWKFL